ncbi:MAG: hypothetical protein M1827_006994 [Pycnora praestabilis]|nr:MAG: hypothetical protein M1827_006994 [Pycnora praestabilis]
MNNSNFVFPPPPPPPPKAASPAYPAYGQPTYAQTNRSGFRGGRGGPAQRSRGRSDGHSGSRGGGGGGYGQRSYNGDGQSGPYAGGQPSFRETPGPVSVDYGGNNYNGPNQLNTSCNYPLPQYPQLQQSQFTGVPSPQTQNTYFSPPAQYNQPAAHTSPSQHRTFNAARPTLLSPYDAAPHQQPYGNGYTRQRWAPPHQQPQNVPGAPPMMGPPIRMGFDQGLPPPEQHYESSSTPYLARGHPFPDQRQPRDHQPQNSYPPNSHTSPYPFPGQRRNNDHQLGRTRGNHSESQKLHSSAPRPKAAPAVPGFGAPLPPKPPAKDQLEKKPKKKKKRKFNLLGLTPRTEEHEESEEEEDVDEEAALSAAVGAGQAQLQFTYKGQTAVLQSSSEITAWIEERKKRFPTKQRIEAKRVELKHRLEESKKAQIGVTQDKVKQKKENTDPKQNAAKEKAKMEKARRQLEKRKERLAAEGAAIARAEAALAAGQPEQIIQGQKRKREPEAEDNVSMKTEKGNHLQVEDRQCINVENENALTLNGEISNAALHQKDPSAAYSELNDPRSSSEAEDAGDSMSISSSSSDSDDSDHTSLSGPSFSDDEEPEEVPSKRDGPQRVPPPKRENPNKICPSFLRTGHCKFKDKCRWLHELPKRGSAQANRAAAMNWEKKAKKEPISRRKTLYQRLVESEKGQEDLLVLQAIKHLAQSGVLDPDTGCGSVDASASVTSA